MLPKMERCAKVVGPCSIGLVSISYERVDSAATVVLDTFGGPSRQLGLWP